MPEGRLYLEPPSAIDRELSNISMLHQAKVLLERAFSQQIAGNWLSALELYGQAYSDGVAQHSYDDIANAVLGTGHCYREMGEITLAVEQLELAYEIAVLHSDDGKAARALNGLATVATMQGNNDEATRIYKFALEFAQRANTPLTIGSIHQNLGTIANVRGDLEDALGHYKSSLEQYEILGHERNMALVLNNLGMLQIDLVDLDSASTSLESALQICRRVGDVVTESVVQTNRTELFLALQATDLARNSCDEAFEISSRIGDNRIKSEALKFYGVIYRESAKPHLAEIHLRQAIGIAAKYGNPLTEAESQRELALVLRAQNRNQEALEALNKSHALFSALQAKQDQADVTKQLARLEGDFLSLVRMWGESIEAKDRYTSGHCQRVANYACRIAEEAGFPKEYLRWFRMGAFLHDVGKTEVPEEILNKPGRLSTEERQLMERHTIVGYEMLSSIQFPWDVLPMVRSHHERWDGEGYPDGLVRDEIPLPARILRIADIFDALTTTRSYRQPLSPEGARQVMEDDAGSFDPELFVIFQKLFPEFADTVRELRQ